MIGPSTEVATVTMTSVPKTQKMSYRNSPISRTAPIGKVGTGETCTAVTAREHPRMLFRRKLGRVKYITTTVRDTIAIEMELFLMRMLRGRILLSTPLGPFL